MWCKYGLGARCRHDGGVTVYYCTGRIRCGSWCSGLVGEPYRMVSLERDSSENDVEGTEVCMGLPNDFPCHVWCIIYWDSEEHLSG